MHDAEHLVERLTPVEAGRVTYEGTVIDPVANNASTVATSISRACAPGATPLGAAAPSVARIAAPLLSGVASRANRGC